MSTNVLFEAVDICKRFDATVALDRVSLTVRRGEIRGLIGENGSGKSTLSSIIAGIQKAGSGSMTLNGQSYEPVNMIDALDKGVGMVVQERGTVSGITVAENITLGENSKYSRWGTINKKALYNQAEQALQGIGVTHIKASDPTDSIDMQDRKLIEIAKIMSRHPEMIIVDETTTVLSQYGREVIYGLMKEMKAHNKSVIFISHDLDELMQVCDSLTVLRDGVFIRNLEKPEFNEDTIKQLMVGREMTGSYYRDDYDGSYGEEVVLSLADGSKGDRLKQVSLSLHKGEILGIGGLSHCGMHTLGKALFGFEKLDSGIVEVAGGRRIRSEREAMELGVGYVSKDRDVEALSLQSSIKDNIVIAGLDHIKRPPFLILSKDEKKYAARLIEQLSVKCASMEQSVQSLSGGNKQKVVFAKWIGRGSDILILDCPTRGVDIGVKQAMYQLIYQLKSEGKSIIIISEELSELIGMSDRLLIMKDGRITGEFARSPQLSESDVISYMI
ncbi:sugar ABC transporter ATP-binding protein [Paenibacillus tepidiphilus]|uniref:sugar ABC transporter ATP-binding protein n=1 Tax=Paenibacillus tepidiphilus TaxID=2608683 RepID=UPI001239C249|nr:sugar ABC transporter ATP-binding protein [Paenibacillus tepidiphilus]